MSRRSLEWWIGIVRLFGIPFAILQVSLTANYPRGGEQTAWILTAILAAGALALFAAVRHADVPGFQLAATMFDFGIVSAFAVLFAFEPGTPTRQLLFLAIVLGAARFGMPGGFVVALAAIPVSAWFEIRRSSDFHERFHSDYVTFQAGAGLLMALLVGWLYDRLKEQNATAEQRADEAELLRDELGRRADLLEAATRCARALSSSLDLDEAFGAFIRELRGLVPFDRMAIVLAEGEVSRVIATAGASAEEIEPPGSESSLENNLVAEIVARGQTVYRADMSQRQYAEEAWLLDVGIHSRVAAPLLTGARAIGLISVGRAEAHAFSEPEIELVSLLGRLAASAVQNIRAYESERRTVDELRRLSELRADFVSLVSHELRSPMAAVIGAARTLQQRWGELQPSQRESFLALIGDETTRLADLIGDVLDTSRIEAGTFSYRFADVDIAALVRDVVASASIAQSEVPLVADVDSTQAVVRCDTDRMRQVFANLIDNAVKYSPAGSPVEVRVTRSDGQVVVAVSDRGEGISRDDQGLIFDKFGRASAGAGTKPGTGLGLYIARSIAEAHGGTLDVTSAPGLGATFTLKLPA